MVRLAVVFAVILALAPSARAGCCQSDNATYPCFTATPADQNLSA